MATAHASAVSASQGTATHVILESHQTEANVRLQGSRALNGATDQGQESINDVSTGTVC